MSNLEKNKYDEMIGKLFVEVSDLKNQLEEMESKNNDMSIYLDDYANQIDELVEENRKLRTRVSELNDTDEVATLRKELKDMTEKKNTYRNQRYALKNEITHLNRKLLRKKKKKDE